MVMGVYLHRWPMCLDSVGAGLKTPRPPPNHLSSTYVEHTLHICYMFEYYKVRSTTSSNVQ